MRVDGLQNWFSLLSTAEQAQQLDLLGEKRANSQSVLKAIPALSQALQFLSDERKKGKLIYPPQTELFNAFALTPPDKVRVVILGQDPYHGEDQAHGLCFSVRKDNTIPPSLRNIFKELNNDISQFAQPSHGDLSHWAKQGVLLLNTVLSVEKAKAHSHKNIGWETFTDRVISLLSQQYDNIIFLLWGAPAQKKISLIDEQSHFVLKAAHPSPLSAHRGFFGCKHFSKTNEILRSQGQQAIKW